MSFNPKFSDESVIPRAFSATRLRTDQPQAEAGIQAEVGLDPRLKHSGVTVLGVTSLDPNQIFEGEFV
jgi:hypothetical protein